MVEFASLFSVTVLPTKELLFLNKSNIVHTTAGMIMQ